MRRFLILLLIAVMLLCCGCGGSEARDTQPESSGQTQQETVPAMDFTVLDARGNEVRLSDFFGKPIVLNFWASWCGPCKSEMPEFNEVYLEMGDEVQFLMVNLTYGNETMESAQSYISSQGYSFPVFYDTRGDAASTYSIRSIPTTFIIDAQGNIAGYVTGAISKQTLLSGIELVTP